MFLLRALGWARDEPTETDDAPFVERRTEERRPVFREAVIALEDYYKVRAVITDISSRGARIQFSERIDLPFLISISEPTFKLKTWARVVWQRDGAAGLQFLRGQ